MRSLVQENLYNSRHATPPNLQCTVLIHQTPFRTKGNVAVFGLLIFGYSLFFNPCIGTLYSTGQHLCMMCSLYTATELSTLPERYHSALGAGCRMEGQLQYKQQQQERPRGYRLHPDVL
jgi:hypothetical protein